MYSKKLLFKFNYNLKIINKVLKGYCYIRIYNKLNKKSRKKIYK